MNPEDFQSFEVGSKLNHGGYGVIMNAKRRSDGTEFVMKFFGYTDNKPDVAWINKEIFNMRALVGISGVAQIEATFNDSARGLITDPRQGIRKKFREEFPVIVMEKLFGGDLCDRILSKCSSDQRRFSERDASIIFTNFIVALCEVHECEAKMINCDLKTENLVFFDDSDDFHVKIIDFGMAIALGDRTEHYDDDLLGTRAYLAPETILSREKTGKAVYSKATDIWQAGCILYIILTAQYPFGDVGKNNKNFQEVRDYIVQGRYSPLDPAPSPEAVDLLNKIFVVDPAKRITGRQILQHPWIANNSAVSENDLGVHYRDRIKSWVLRRKFKNFLVENVVGSTNRKRALELALVDFAPKEHTNVAANVRPSPSAVGRQPSINTQKPDSVVISAEEIKKLKKSFVGYFASHVEASNNANGDTEQRKKSVYAQQTLQHEGITYDVYCQIVNNAGFNYMACHKIFDIFDWDKNGTVDYMEFLLTLSSFRIDIDWADVASAARLYFDIFDLHGTDSINRDVLILIFSKLLQVRCVTNAKFCVLTISFIG
jgi:serine/threonine protein kinase